MTDFDRDEWTNADLKREANSFTRANVRWMKMFRSSLLNAEVDGADYLWGARGARRSNAPTYQEIVLMGRVPSFDLVEVILASYPRIEKIMALEYPIAIGKGRQGEEATLLGEFVFVGSFADIQFKNGRSVHNPRVYEFRAATIRPGLYVWAAWLIGTR